ncbi:hypothetical protein BDB01DRAFT_835667 [Pilobolus umbonatus]|nr:hypothetical protein BDB01DRAFT_835667 [Pilobolus umbonatus]
MLQDLDLDFDTYFDVASANQQQQQQQSSQNRDILYHGDQSTNNSLNSILNNNANTNNNIPPRNSYQYALSTQNNDFNIFDWDLNPHQQSNRERSPMQISPASSPQSSSDGYTSHSLSPTMHSPPNPMMRYAFNPTIKEEAQKAVADFFQTSQNNRTSLYSINDLHLDGNMPGINIPSTPLGEIPSNNKNIHRSPSVSPLMNENPLSGAFTTIDQWCHLKVEDNVIHPLDVNSDDHETRHWRKSSSRQMSNGMNAMDNTNGRGRIIEPGKQLKKVAHNAIERRYRNNINDRIRELKNVVPALYKARIKEKGDDDDDDSDSGAEEIVDGVEVAKKLNKATILRKATEYIQFLKNNNDTTDQENRILQQIIAQMPGGGEVLQRFLVQKSDFEKAEAERLARDRRTAQERERTERQRILRERAAQRAALAQLLPKPERRPYRRRQSKKNSTSSKKSAEDENGNKMFMAAFMCLALFASSPGTERQLQHAPSHGFSLDNQTTSLSPHSFMDMTYSTSLDIWYVLRYLLFAVGIIYVLLVPIIFHWLRPRSVSRPRKCLDHHHYANEVPTAWSRLYTNLTSIVRRQKAPENSTVFTISTVYDIIRNSITLVIPKFMISLFHRNAKPVGCPEELSYVSAWIRLNEVECLGGNPDITQLGMLQSCVGMLAQLHKMKRDEKHLSYYGPNALARVYTTTAIQLELCLPKIVSSHLSTYCWNYVIKAMKFESENEDNQLLPAKWANSNCHDQVLQILSVRNGFNSLNSSDPVLPCRNIFYSFVLPYVTSPLDLVLYWQQLSNLQTGWLTYMNGTRPVFSEKQLSHMLTVSATTTAPSHMLQWWVRVGLALQSLSSGSEQKENLDMLAEYTRTTVPAVNNQPSSNLLRRHQTMIYNLLEAATALQVNGDATKVPKHLKLAAKDRRASGECIQQIASTTSRSPTANYEASILVLSTLSVHLRTLKALIVHQTSGKRPSEALPANEASVYIAELRDQVMRDMESPYTKCLSTKCRKHIQTYISQADDTLSL